MDATSDATLAGTAELALTPQRRCNAHAPRAEVRRALRQRPHPHVLIQKPDGLLTKSHPFLQCVTRFPEHCLR